MKFTRLIRLGLCCWLLLISAWQVQAQDAPEVAAFTVEEQALDTSVGHDELVRSGDGIGSYAWIIGSTFIPRHNAITYQYGTLGCIYVTGGGTSGDQDNFVAPVHLPQGAVIYGIRFFYRDSSDATSRVFLQSFDAQGSFSTIAVASSEGSAGAGSIFVNATNPYTVQNELESLAVVWTPGTQAISQQLCGVRIAYQLPPQGAPAPHHTFISGQLFTSRASNFEYEYGGNGCLVPQVGSWTVDVDIPSGSRIEEMTLYTNDTLTKTVYLSLRSYDGFGNYAEQAFVTSDYVDGYSQISVALDPPYIVDQSSESLNLTIGIPTSAPVAGLCGVRIRYTPGAAPGLARGDPAVFPPRLYYSRALSGNTFHRRESNATYIGYGDIGSLGCTYATSSNAVFVADLQLPEGAQMERLDYLYQDTVENVNTSLSITRFESNGTTYSSTSIADSISIDNSFIRYTQIDPSVMVDHSEGGLILDWRPFHDTDAIKLCQARVLYSLPAKFIMLPMVQR